MRSTRALGCCDHNLCEQEGGPTDRPLVGEV